VARETLYNEIWRSRRRRWRSDTGSSSYLARICGQLKVRAEPGYWMRRRCGRRRLAAVAATSTWRPDRVGPGELAHRLYRHHRLTSEPATTQAGKRANHPLIIEAPNTSRTCASPSTATCTLGRTSGTSSTCTSPSDDSDASGDQQPVPRPERQGHRSCWPSAGGMFISAVRTQRRFKATVTKGPGRPYGHVLATSRSASRSTKPTKRLRSLIVAEAMDPRQGSRSRPLSTPTVSSANSGLRIAPYHG